MDNEKHYFRIAMIDGKEMPYTVCSGNRETFRYQETNLGWEYLGEGIIWKTNVVSQNSERRLHFWNRNNERRT